MGHGVGKPLALVPVAVGRGVELEVGNRREQEGLSLGVRSRYAIGAFRYGKSRLVRRVNLSLPEDFVSLIEAHKPRSLTLTAFCAVLIEQGLTQGANLPAYCVGAGTPDGQKAVTAVQTSSPKQAGNPQPPTQAVEAVPPKGKKFEPRASLGEFSKFEEDLLAFWKVKRGAKNERAWKLLLTELGKIRDKYGEQALVEQLQAGAQSGMWQSLTLVNYEKFLPKAAAKEPEHRHPASQVYTAKDFDLGPSSNPVIEGLF